MALLAKKSGIVSTWPMPTNCSRVLTNQRDDLSRGTENKPQAEEVVRHPLFPNTKETVYGFLKAAIGFGADYHILYCYFRIVRLCKPQ